MLVNLYNTPWTSCLHFSFEGVKQLKTLIPWTINPIKSPFLSIENLHVLYINLVLLKYLPTECCWTNCWCFPHPIQDCICHPPSLCKLWFVLSPSPSRWASVPVWVAFYLKQNEKWCQIQLENNTHDLNIEWINNLIKRFICNTWINFLFSIVDACNLHLHLS